jgi:hypothetical protein
VRSTLVVVNHPFCKKPPQMPFVQRDHEIQEIPQRSSHFLDEGLGQHSQFLVKERVVPGQDLVHKDFAIPFSTATWNPEPGRPENLGPGRDRLHGRRGQGFES